MVRRPVVSSILSKHTGHVGSSTREGVGGARGFVEKDVGATDKEATPPDPFIAVVSSGRATNGSCVISGKLD